MKITFQIVLVILTLLSCTKPTGLKMDVSSTKEVLISDTKHSIITKAAHIIPTPNQ